jgi:AcrR family transcriptional regulator
MIRVTKEPEIRKKEILEVALNLFFEKGYEETSVSDIVKSVGVAQGTFYYYYNSKSEVLDAIIESYIQMANASAQKIIIDNNLNSLEKMERLLSEEFCLSDKHSDFVMKLHMIKNQQIHQIFLVKLIEKYVTYFSYVVEEGNKEGFFDVENPLETVEILMVGFHFILDPGIIPWNENEYLRRIRAAGSIVENALKAKKGSFDFFPKLLEDNIRRIYECTKNSNQN